MGAGGYPYIRPPPNIFPRVTPYIYTTLWDTLAVLEYNYV